MVFTHGYDVGRPWCDGFFFDVGAFFIGGLARDTSHKAWMQVFKATAESQTAAVKYCHKFFRDEGRRPEVKVFESMVGRLIVVVNMADIVLRPAGVDPAAIEGVLQSVSQGSHAFALDSFLSMPLDEGFVLEKVRQVASAKLPFLEVIINGSRVASMGLTPDKIHDLEASQAAARSKEWCGSAQLDINAYIQAMAAYQASTTNYEDSQKLHEAKREANATRAVSKYLFGLSMGEDGSSTLASGSAAASVGFMLLQPMPLADYATKFTSALRAYKTALMSTPCVCRQSAVEADVATVVLCDFAQMGSLKQEVLVAAKAVMTVGTRNVSSRRGRRRWPLRPATHRRTIRPR